METKQKILNLAKQYLVEDESIAFKNSFGEVVIFTQKNDKIVEEMGEIKIY